MPFVQMENISHFLRASQSPPFNLQSHDLFQTVDLYEAKDPAQVLQCIAAFSRKAHGIQPSRFPTLIGEKSKSGIVSPQVTGSYNTASPQTGRPRNSSNLSESNSTISSNPSYAAGGRASPFRSPAANSVNDNRSQSPGGISSWSRKTDESNTTPAWNIHQYGYMGGASQANQNISFGARRQITTQAPKVPSLAEKERKRREEQADAERQRIQTEEAEAQRRKDREAEEESARAEEHTRWEEETRRQRELEKQQMEEEKRRWQEEERRWREEEEQRAREDREVEARMASERNLRKASGDVKLTGQFLSQYKAEQSQSSAAESARIKELERQLEEAKAREAQYQRERAGRMAAEEERRERSRSRPVDPSYRRDKSRSKSRTRSVPVKPSQPVEEDPWEEDERAYLQKQWAAEQASAPQIPRSTRPLPSPTPTQPPPPTRANDSPPPPQPSRPLPTPQSHFPSSSVLQQTETPLPPPQPPRPLPTPTATSTTAIPPSPTKSPRKSPFTRPQPTPSPPIATAPPTYPPAPSNSTSTPTAPSQSNPLRKPPFSNPSSLLSREMELDRQRQQEWEQNQKAVAAAEARGEELGTGEGAWDIHQYGYLGGDSQNRGGRGIGIGGRRQLVGPREMGGGGAGGGKEG